MFGSFDMSDLDHLIEEAAASELTTAASSDPVLNAS